MSIIIVDDDTSMLEVLSGILESFNQPHESYSDPEEALESFRKNPDRFFGAILDYNLGTTTGTNLSDEMREINPDIEFIFCTATSDNHNRNLIEERGMWLPKPLNAHTSYALIRYFIEMCSGKLDVVEDLNQALDVSRNISIEAIEIIEKLLDNNKDESLARKAQVVITMLEEMTGGTSEPPVRPTQKPTLRIVK